MCLPERGVRRGGHVQVTLLCLTEGLRDEGGGLVGKGSGDEGRACEEGGTVEGVLRMRNDEGKGSWKGRSESGGFASRNASLSRSIEIQSNLLGRWMRKSFSFRRTNLKDDHTEVEEEDDENQFEQRRKSKKKNP